MDLCRLCACQHELSNLIDMQSERSYEICKKVEMCCNVFIELTDNSLPTVVCKLCMNKLNVSYEFYKKVNHAQTMLRHLMMPSVCTAMRHSRSPCNDSREQTEEDITPKTTVLEYPPSFVITRHKSDDISRESYPNKCREPSKGAEEENVSNPTTLEVGVAHKTQIDENNCINNTELRNLQTESNLPSQPQSREELNSQNSKNVQDSDCIQSHENPDSGYSGYDLDMLDLLQSKSLPLANEKTASSGSDREHLFPKDDMINVDDLSDTEEENCMETEGYYNENADAMLAAQLALDDSDITHTHPFSKEEMKSLIYSDKNISLDNHDHDSGKDISLDNHDSDVEGNILTIVDVVSDNEDATSSPDENYLQEIFNILEKEKEKIAEEKQAEASEDATNSKKYNKEECENLDFINTTIKQEKIDSPEEEVDESQRENSEPNIMETNNESVNQILIKDIKSEVPFEDYQPMETEFEEFVQVNGYPEIKKEIVDEHEKDYDNQIGAINYESDTIFAENTNEVSYAYDYNSRKQAKEPLKSWKSYQHLCCFCSYRETTLIDLITHTHLFHMVREKDMIFKCSDCSDIINNYYDYLSHVQSLHHPSLRLRCDGCDMLCSNEVEYGLHRHAECVVAERLPDYTRCPYCYRSFSTIEWKQIHIRLHLKPNPDVKLQCKLCSMETSSRCALNQHEITHQ